MSTKGLNFLQRIFYYKSLKKSKSILDDEFLTLWQEKSWDDYSLYCLKMESELVSSILFSLGAEQLSYRIELTALRESRKNELDYLNNLARSVSIGEYKNLFQSDYRDLITKVEKMKLDFLNEHHHESLVNTHSRFIQKNQLWHYIQSCMFVYAIHEFHVLPVQEQLIGKLE